MMDTKDLNTPIWMLTVGELIDFLQREQRPVQIIEKGGKQEKHVYGIDGLARLLGCSKATAQNIKSSGIIDKAITQIGRTIIVDAELAMELIRRKK